MNQKARHALRIVIGLYLAYLGWQLFDTSVFKGNGNVLIGVVLGSVCLIIGLLYAIASIRKVLEIRKEEQCGESDFQGETDNSEELEKLEGNEPGENEPDGNDPSENGLDEIEPEVTADIPVQEKAGEAVGDTESPVPDVEDNRGDMDSGIL